MQINDYTQKKFPVHVVQIYYTFVTRFNVNKNVKKKEKMTLSRAIYTSINHHYY